MYTIQRHPDNYLHQDVMFLPGFVCGFVCSFVCEQDNSKTYGQILMIFSGYVSKGKRKK